MTGVFIVKGLIISMIWTIAWVMWFAHTYADVNLKNLGTAMAPWIVTVLYFLLFWWG